MADYHLTLNRNLLGFLYRFNHVLTFAILFLSVLLSTYGEVGVQSIPDSAKAAPSAAAGAAAAVDTPEAVVEKINPENETNDANDRASFENEGFSSPYEMTLNEAKEEAEKWICGEDTELIFFIANEVSGSGFGAKFIKALPMVEVEKDCAQLKVFSQRDEESLSLGLNIIKKTVAAKEMLYHAAAEATEQPQQQEQQHQFSRSSISTAAAAAADEGNTWDDKEPSPGATAGPATPAAAAAAAGAAVGAAAAATSEIQIPLEKRVRIIAVGGDGAFTGMIKQLIKKNINMNFTVTGIIPSGTGNDLAHTYGWVKAKFPPEDPLGLNK